MLDVDNRKIAVVGEGAAAKPSRSDADADHVWVLSRACRRCRHDTQRRRYYNAEKPLQTLPPPRTTPHRIWKPDADETLQAFSTPTRIPKIQYDGRYVNIKYILAIY
jgi:hypothetical protein